MTEQRLLVVRLSSLGDIVHTFPAVAALRESFPKAEITWLTHPRWKQVVESSGLAHVVWTVETRSWSSLREIIAQVRGRGFQLAIDFQGLWKSAMLSFFAGVSRRIGFSSETIREFGVPILYTDRVHCRTTHIAEQNGELALRAGAKGGVANFHLAVASQDEEFVCSTLKKVSVEKYFVTSPGGGWRSKCWPAERYGALCSRIWVSMGLRCVINCGPGEEPLANAVRDSSGAANPIVFNEPLGRLMALLRGAVCIVGGDTGPLHLGIALGAPSVSLFGPTNPARNGPYRPDAAAVGDTRDIVLHERNTERTHRRDTETHPSLLAIEVETVFNAVRRIVECAP
jgi:heptosyltransferase I